MTDIGELAGQTVGPYELRELLGRGELTAVYRAYQHAKRREVAVKVMHEDLSSATGYLERFSIGARAAASLDHPHIIPFYDYGTQTGLSYVVTRHLTGGTLAERIRHAAGQNLPRASLSEIAEFLSQIASALDYAHLKGIYHDGIRPENILFDNRGTAYVADFGVARLLRQMAPARNGLAYLAPERWRNTDATAAADQYGLAMIAYQLVAGRLPFEGVNEQQLMYEHLNEPPPALAGTRPELPEAVSLVLERALSKDPSARFRSMTAFAQTFKSAIEGVRGEPSGFFVYKLPKRERQPVPPPAIRVMQPAKELDETVPSTPVQNAVPTAQSAPVLVERPTAPSAPVLIEGKTVPSVPMQIAEPEEEKDEVSEISAVTRPSRKMPFSAPTASPPVASYPAEAKPPLERSERKRVSRREFILGLVAIAVMTLTMIAVKMVRGELGPANVAGDPTQPAAIESTRLPAVVLLPTDTPAQAPALANSEVAIAAEMVASNAVEFSVPADAGLTAIAWDFGDGATAAEAVPIHTYADSGIYTVRMTATGPDGNEVATSAEITVIEGCILTPKEGAAELYEEPVTVHAITTLGRIPEGSQLFTAESRRGRDGFIWYRVTHDGVAGWVHSSAVRAVSGRCP